MIRRNRVHRGFPRSIASLRNLQGGPYGDLTLTAVSRERMDLQLGDCYVILTRKHVEDMRDAMQRFIEYGRLTDEEMINLEEVEITTNGAIVEDIVVADRERTTAHRKRAKTA